MQVRINLNRLKAVDPRVRYPPLAVPPHWSARGICSGTADPDRFFPDQPRLDSTDKPTPPAVCFTCPVTRECAQYGADTGSAGWWGGEFLAGPALPDENDDNLEVHCAQQAPAA